MRAGEASATARRVAAQRLTFERVPAPFGDAEADARLARDVAGSAEGAPGPLTAYLAARTAFFDRVVVNAIEGGATQVVVAGAGYDGRALRYCRSGVRWFELDHPDTQRDKRSRLERLGIPTGHVGFAPADFTIDDVASALDGAGHDRTVPSTILCEGVAVYLERDVLARLLRGLRHAAACGSRLAISLSVATSRPEEDGRRAAFASAVDAMGEPARDVLTADGATELLVEAGWIPDVGEAHRRCSSGGLRRRRRRPHDPWSVSGTPVGGERARLLRRGLHLEYVTLGWNVVGVVVLAVAAVGARSVALAGFGLDSLVEILASAVVVGELRATATPEREQRALRLIGLAFFGLSAYIAAQGLLVLVLRARPAISGLGIAWTGVTCAVMFVLAGAKTATGSRLDHPVLLTEGKVTRIDALLAGAVVGGLVLRAVAGWWWADPLAGFVIVGYGIKEGGAAWSHSHL